MLYCQTRLQARDQPAEGMRITMLTLALALIASGEAQAEETLLSCWGAVDLMQEGMQVNVPNRQWFFSLKCLC
jgi:hypothetical protein